MHAHHPATLRTLPSCAFVLQELPYAEGFNLIEVPDHAHAVSGPVALIQMLQCGTGKTGALKAVGNGAAGKFLAVFDSAGKAGN